jgi:hypothetical protein
VKPDTKIKNSVTLALDTGSASGDSSESDDADSKNKLLWERVKTFCYNHRTEIAIGVVVIISIILYGQYRKPYTPPGGSLDRKKDINNFANSPFDVSYAYLEALREVELGIIAIMPTGRVFAKEQFTDKRNEVVEVIDTLRNFSASETNIKPGYL